VCTWKKEKIKHNQHIPILDLLIKPQVHIESFTLALANFIFTTKFNIFGAKRISHIHNLSVRLVNKWSKAKNLAIE
jgi:hypothetical protein